jgi:two-component system cell cycle sensor histidine kinase/response regulator CckA
VEDYGRLFEELPISVFISNADGICTQINRSWQDLTGITADQAHGQLWLEWVHPEDQHIVSAWWQATCNHEGLGQTTYRLITRDGRQRHIEHRLRSEQGRFVHVLSDITAQMRALEKAEARLDAVMNIGPQVLVILDQAHSVQSFNHRAALSVRERFDHPLKPGDNFERFVTRMDDFAQSFSLALKGQSLSKERRIKGADRQEFTYQLSYLPILNAVGQVMEVCFMAMDVEEQRRIRSQLQQDQAFLSTLLDTVGALIVVMNTEGQIVRFNRACEQLTGYSSQEVQGQLFSALFLPPEEQATVMARFHQIIQSTSAEESTHIWVGRDGSRHRIAWNHTVMLNSHGQVEYIIGTGIDITAREQAEKALRESEEMLRQSQKMEAIGHLAGGVAHDFNNLLVGIMGYSQLLLESMPPGSPLSTHILEIQKICEKARTLTSQLLIFSRKSKSRVQPVSLNQVIQHMWPLVQRLLGEHIECCLNLSPSLPLLEADPMHLEQMILNLSVNARDAMSYNGVLTLETQSVYKPEPWTTPLFGSRPAGDYICLRVKDSGCGISPETLEHIFDPFFTTKEAGKGTGLGLAIVYGIVRDYKGAIAIESEPGAGAQFEIYLPAQKRMPPLFVNRPQIGCYGLDPAQFATLTQALERDYQISQITDLNTLEASQPALLITDLLCAPQITADLYQRYPELKTLYLAGYSDQEMAYMDELQPHEEVLIKPFAPEDIQTRVRRMLLPLSTLP